MSFPITADKHVRFLDHSNEKTIFHVKNNALASFAIDDAIAESVGKNLSPPTVRTWVHEPTIVLGIPDSRLPYIEKGFDFISKQANTVIRNSGGLAVFLDRGVLNMSVIIPSNREVSITDGYDMMYAFIQQLFKAYTTDIQAYEIIGSYCPGDYDLSINGIKFAGISQRRVRNGIAVQIYLDITGSSHARAKLVKDFYQMSIGNATTSYDYPDIDPRTMGTISQLLNITFTVDDVIKAIKDLLQSNHLVTSDSFTPEERKAFDSRLQQMKKRNERLP